MAKAAACLALRFALSPAVHAVGEACFRCGPVTRS